MPMDNVSIFIPFRGLHWKSLNSHPNFQWAFEMNPRWAHASASPHRCPNWMSTTQDTNWRRWAQSSVRFWASRISSKPSIFWTKNTPIRNVSQHFGLKNGCTITVRRKLSVTNCVTAPLALHFVTKRNCWSHRITSKLLVCSYVSVRSGLISSRCRFVYAIDESGRESFIVPSNVPKDLNKKMECLSEYDQYMKLHLRNVQNVRRPRNPGMLPRIPHLHVWFRTEEAITMHLSNGIVQVTLERRAGAIES